MKKSINKMDDASLTILSDAINKRLFDIEQEFGVSMRVGNVSYADLKATFKVEAVISSIDVRKIDFEKYCKLYNLSASDYGRKFLVNNSEYIISGINVKARKLPIIAKKISDNKEYIFTASDVKFKLK